MADFPPPMPSTSGGLDRVRAQPRISHADREQVARSLSEHAGGGRLTLVELEDRLTQLFAARTVAELELVTVDLPTTSMSPSARRRPSRWIVSVMGGADVYVPDTVELDVGGFSLLGGTDERGSVRAPRPGGPSVRLRVFSLMGGSNVWRLPAEAGALPLARARAAAET